MFIDILYQHRTTFRISTTISKLLLNAIEHFHFNDVINVTKETLLQNNSCVYNNTPSIFILIGIQPVLFIHSELLDVVILRRRNLIQENQP